MYKFSFWSQLWIFACLLWALLLVVGWDWQHAKNLFDCECISWWLAGNTKLGINNFFFFFFLFFMSVLFGCSDTVAWEMGCVTVCILSWYKQIIVQTFFFLFSLYVLLFNHFHTYDLLFPFPVPPLYFCPLFCLPLPFWHYVSSLLNLS